MDDEIGRDEAAAKRLDTEEKTANEVEEWKVEVEQDAETPQPVCQTYDSEDEKNKFADESEWEESELDVELLDAETTQLVCQTILQSLGFSVKDGTPEAIFKEILRELTSADVEPDRVLQQYAAFLTHATIRLFGRTRLAHIEDSMPSAVDLIRKSKNIIVLTGAGISVSCGIPDFRSPGGLYETIQKRYQLPDPQCMFDIGYFRDDPHPFFDFAKELFPGKFRPSWCHYFIRLLEARGKLLRNYTQNIDTLEQQAGITKLVQCHGSFATATCMRCKRSFPGEQIKSDVLNSIIPICQFCKAEILARKQKRLDSFNSKKRKRPESHSSSDEEQEEKELQELSQAILKPDIVFFGEKLPDVFQDCFIEDREKCDLLIVIGSSLAVRPVCLIPDMLDPQIPQILINLGSTSRSHQFDINIANHCDNVIIELTKALNWELPCNIDIEKKS